MAERLPAKREITGEAIALASEAISASRPAEPVQEEMFQAPAVPAATEKLPAGQSLSPHAVEAEAERRRKVGRPPGSQNKATKQLREWLLRGGVLPQKWAMDWLLMEPEQLAARLGMTVAEAFARQVTIAEGLYPYFMARMAPTDDKGNAVPFLSFSLGAPALDEAGRELPPWEVAARKRAMAETNVNQIDAEAEEVSP